MPTRYFVLVIGIILVACSTATEAPPTTLPEPTIPPEPTATPTELVATEIPPSPTPTESPPATPTQIPTATSVPVQFDFTWYENNPILNKGASGDWDNWRVWDSKIVPIDDVIHMFYLGITGDSNGIGYAISTDGLTFAKFEKNPVFQPDGVGFDASGFSGVVPFVENDIWMLYYNASADGERYGWDLPAGTSVGLTTAPDPTGPWSAGQLVLKAGENGEWDSGVILPRNIFFTEDGYRMYYAAESKPVDYDYMCGMATSQDGIVWTKYDNPSTTEAPFAESDPVMKPSPVGWDSFGVLCSVIKTDTGWEMFYDGWTSSTPARIGYAFSSDGINWTKYKGNPGLGSQRSPTSAIKIGSTYYIYTHDWDSAAMYGAFGTIDQP
jgi:hypothetical protein